MAPDNTASDLSAAVQLVSEKAQLVIREEIELAKAEVSTKVSKLVKGAIVGLVAGIFAVTGLMFLLHGAAWGVWYGVFGEDTADFFWGFLVVAVLLFLLGALAGFLAARAVRAGTPPTPSMAIDEARRIRETVAGHGPAAGR